VDLSDLKDILRMLEEQEITEFELEQDGVKLRICRSSGAAATHPAPTVASPAPEVPATSAASPPGGTASVAAVPGPSATKEEASGDQGAPKADGAMAVGSPIVGTFYRASDPNASPFVNVGDQVQVGQVLCIIEAMKLMNEIEAEVAGEVLQIHPENGQPVQYGDPLFTIRPA
jgi:acetyl-CoA carboxylase biotin carboxyl carrier protein